MLIPLPPRIEKPTRHPVLARIWKDTWGFTKGQLLISTIVSIIVIPVSVKIGLLQEAVSLPTVGIVLGVNASVFVVTFLVNLFRAPYGELKKIREENADLQAYGAQMRATFLGDGLFEKRVKAVRAEWDQFNEREKELACRLLIRGKQSVVDLKDHVDGARLSSDMQRLQESVLMDYSLALVTWAIKSEFAKALELVIRESDEQVQR